MKEIKASDLRIGNLVNYRYYNPDPKGPDWAYEAVEIVEIKQSHLVFKHLNKKTKFKIAVLYPIPLTEEWLERFGFQKRESSTCNAWYIGNNEITHDWLFDIVWLHRPELINSPNFPFYKNGRHLIQYVHTLQNLYHALTGEELTINN